MHPVLKRIAVNGLLSGLVLGLIGLAFAELASLWLAASPVRPAAGSPAAAGPIADPVAGILRTRVPVMMAVWGFLFVALGEGVLYLWRGGRAAATGTKPPTGPKPDPAEVLLDDILRQVEAARAREGSEALPPPGPVPRAEAPPVEPASSPSTATAQNSPTPELVPGEPGA